MANPTDSANTNPERGKKLLSLLIGISLTVTFGALLSKIYTSGLDRSWPSVGRIFIESAMWLWLWKGSNVARIIWLILFWLGLAISICTAMYFGQVWLFDRGASMANVKVARLLCLLMAGFSTYAGYAAYTLQLPSVRAFVDRFSSRTAAISKLMDRKSTNQPGDKIDLSILNISKRE